MSEQFDNVINETIKLTIKDLLKEQVNVVLENSIVSGKLNQIIQECITDDLIKEIIRDFLLERYNGYLVNDDDLVTIFHKNKKNYLNRLNNILEEILDDKKIKNNISDTIKERYFENVTDNCVFVDLLEEALKGYTIEFVPKRKNGGQLG